MIERNQIEFKKIIKRERSIIEEISYLCKVLEKTNNSEEKRIIQFQIKSLKGSLKKVNEKLPETLNKISLVSPLNPKTIQLSPVETIKDTPLKIPQKVKPKKKLVLLGLEKETLKRLKSKKKEVKREKIKKPSIYVKTASKIFSNISMPLSEEKMFKRMRKDLIRADLQFIPANYISVLLFTTLLSVILGIFLFVFFLFFNINPTIPIITSVEESITARFLKTFWILFVVPIGTFLFIYFYPSLERKAIETKIGQELPFATIHMSAIAGSMIEPSKIFKIIILTKEYPSLEKKFTRLLNEINVYGYDLASALKNMASNNPGTKLSDLFNGIAVTINSGGDLPEFFNKRSESLLFEHRLEREKQTRSAETFMDIYISVVIAAPMILMILLMMMKISGLGISLNTSMITLIMISSITLINILFLSFLHLKQPKT
jgi:Flp pilus assembly protein TadB